MKIEAREYKLLVEHEPFRDPAKAVPSIWGEIEDAVKMLSRKTLPAVSTKGQFEKKEARRVLFLDTPNFTLRRYGLALRQRAEDNKVEYTLKCRSDDRWLVVETAVHAIPSLQPEIKLEEDIAPPFRCRLSRSATISGKIDGPNALPNLPKNLREGAALFPILGTLRHDGQPCSLETTLSEVHNLTVEETVWKGSKLVFKQPSSASNEQEAGVTLTLWARGQPSRPVIAELSFRIKEGEVQFVRDLAVAAREIYELLLRLDCARLEGLTKTEYIYRDAQRD